MKKIIFAVLIGTFLLSCRKEVNSQSQCPARRSFNFYGVVTDTTQQQLLRGVVLVVSISPFGLTFSDTTDSIGNYSIEYPCPMIPTEQYYTIIARHCSGINQSRGPILLGFFTPIHNVFEF